MKINENGNVLVSKVDCKAVRLIMGLNTDLRVRMERHTINDLYLQASSVVKLMVENHLCMKCTGEEMTNILSNNMLLFDLAIKMLRGNYDYE